MRLIAAVLMVTSLLTAGQVQAREQPDARADGKGESVTASDERVPLAEIRRFVSVFNAVRAAYVEPVAENTLMQGAIKGLLLDLDPHSVYFDADDAKAFADQAEGSYEGIGVEVQVLEDQTLRIIAPIEGGPAEKAGVRAGDRVVSVDGKDMQRLQGSEPLRGPAGTRVRLGIARDGVDKPLSITVERQAIQLSSLRSRLLEPGYAHVRISNFQADTGADFDRHVQQLLKDHGPLKGVVLDLRSNPGGLLTAAVEVADSLLDSGVIVSTRGRLSVSDTRFEATPGQLLPDVAIVVLVDGGSASASEVLAGALRDNQRARIVGSQTFGKGSVQTVLPLDNRDSVKLTTARYFTPAGRSIQGVGIAPDVVLHNTSVDESQPDDGTGPGYSEAALDGHLVGEEENGAKTDSPRGVMLPGDTPLQSALAELKVWVSGKLSSNDAADGSVKQH